MPPEKSNIHQILSLQLERPARDQPADKGQAKTRLLTIHRNGFNDAHVPYCHTDNDSIADNKYNLNHGRL